MNDANRGLPLAGVRVLDLSRVLAGPMCAQALGDFGAEVIKVEMPRRGDDTRDWGLKVGSSNTTYFNSANRNKQSICLDLQTAEGQRIARELAQRSDAVIQNFKFGGAEKMGLGYEALRELNPALVYCSISGYGRSGPEAARPGYDLVVQGEAGLMALNGEKGQGPLKFGVAMVDIMSGMYAAQAVLAALYERQQTGKGRHVEIALYDCGLMITSYCGMQALAAGEELAKSGNEHPSIVPYGVFDAADGPLVITVGNNAQFARFCNEVIDRPDLARDERFRTNVERCANREVLIGEIRSEIGRRNRKELLRDLVAAGIPCGEVLGLLEALQSERTAQAGLLVQAPPSESGSAAVLAPPYRLDGERLPVRAAPPGLGQDTRAVLRRELGMGDADLGLLAEQGVI